MAQEQPQARESMPARMTVQIPDVAQGTSDGIVTAGAGADAAIGAAGFEGAACSRGADDGAGADGADRGGI